jgi:hypothetical protein
VPAGRSAGTPTRRFAPIAAAHYDRSRIRFPEKRRGS